MALLALALLAFWAVLSGFFDPFHLSLGALSVAGVLWSVRRLGDLEPAVRGLHAGTWLRWPAYIPWLLWQIVLSAWDVAKIVLSPRLPIEPHIVRFRCRMPHNVAHLTLANSITLTPGTVTLNLDDDEYVIHALTQPAGASLIPPKGEGEMQARVRRIFS